MARTVAENTRAFWGAMATDPPSARDPLVLDNTPPVAAANRHVLPAPTAPTTATTSPGRTQSVTSSRAGVSVLGKTKVASVSAASSEDVSSCSSVSAASGKR